MRSRLALAGEGELAAAIAIAVLIDDAADACRIQPALDTVEHDLRDGGLPRLGLAAGLEIDRFRQAAGLAAKLFRIDRSGIIWT
jgi:hypothetical protein